MTVLEVGRKGPFIYKITTVHCSGASDTLSNVFCNIGPYEIFAYLDLISLFAVRSFGIIGGGAVLFAATSIAGQLILPAVGGKRRKKILATMFFRHRGGSSRRRRSGNLLSSLLHCTLWSMLPAAAGEEGKGQMPTIMLVRLRLNFS